MLLVFLYTSSVIVLKNPKNDFVSPNDKGTLIIVPVQSDVVLFETLIILCLSSVLLLSVVLLFFLGIFLGILA